MMPIAAAKTAAEYLSTIQLKDKNTMANSKLISVFSVDTVIAR
jgi:hypothetical protein